MDGVYDILESVHVFIPIIAVVFLVVMVFLFGLARTTEVEPPVGYIDKLHKEKPMYKEGLPKPINKVASPKIKTNPRHESKEVPKSVTQSPVKDAKKNDESSTVRQRKKEKKDVQYEAADEGDWVTVSPKKKAKSPSGESPPPMVAKSPKKEKQTPSSPSNMKAPIGKNEPALEELLQQAPEDIIEHAEDIHSHEDEERNDNDDQSPLTSHHSSLDEPIQEAEPAQPIQDSPKKSKKKKTPKESPTEEEDGWTTQMSAKNRKQKARRVD